MPPKKYYLGGYLGLTPFKHYEIEENALSHYLHEPQVFSGLNVKQSAPCAF